MRYRKLDDVGDYTFGHGQHDFLVNTPETVAQAVMTRLRLWLGEWFTDTADGTPWMQEVLDKYTERSRDVVLRARVLATPGVTGILAYRSSFDPAIRLYVLDMLVDTLYGTVQITAEATNEISKDRLNIDFFLNRSHVL